MKFYLCLFWCVLILGSCNDTTKEKIDVSVQNSVNGVQFAKHFRFFQKGNSTVLEIYNPETKEKIIKLFPLEANKKIVTLSTTVVGMLDKLGLTDVILGVSDLKYIDNKVVLKNQTLNKVFEVGYDTQLNLELIINLKPALLLYNGYGTSFPHKQQLENTGIQCIPIFDWKEETPLGRAEWIKVYGFLFGKEDEANVIFESIKDRYLESCAIASKLEPSKLLMSGNIIGDEWYTPAGDSFFAQLLKDANVSYHYYNTQGTGSIAITQEKMLLDNQTAAYWINPGANSLQQLKNMNSKSIMFDSYRNKNVFCHTHNENFYWETSSIEPDNLLLDLIQIAHPNDYHSERELYFYKQLE